MKINYPHFIFLLFCLLLISCSIETVRENVNIEGEHGFNFMESKQEWDKLKTKNGNSYFYIFLEQSFTGIGSETKITVERGKVISRHYEAYVISEEDGKKNTTFSYAEESKKDLGKHSEGAAPVTIDELYRSCLAQYLIADPDANRIYFETNEEGVIVLCGFVPFGCQDDCYRGITISQFSWM